MSESITALHPLVVLFALRQDGVNGNGLGREEGAGELRRQENINSRRDSASCCNCAHNAPRVSRESRIFWRLQNISGIRDMEIFSGNTRFVVEFSNAITEETEKFYVRAEKHVKGRERKEMKEQRWWSWEEKWGKRGNQKLLSPSWPRMLSDFFYRDRYRSGACLLDPQKLDYN